MYPYEVVLFLYAVWQTMQSTSGLMWLRHLKEKPSALERGTKLFSNVFSGFGFLESVCLCCVSVLAVNYSVWPWYAVNLVVQCESVSVRNNLHSVKDWQDGNSCDADTWNVNENLSVIMIQEHTKLFTWHACWSTFCYNDCFYWNHHHYYTNNKITGLRVSCTKFAFRNEAVKLVRQRDISIEPDVPEGYCTNSLSL